jgi:hypothetical protein
MRRTTLLLLFLISALAAGAQQEPSWLHPNAPTLQQAVDDGYKLAGLKDKYRFLTLRVTPPGSMAKEATIALKGPLVCAFDIGTFAARNLRPKPVLDQVKQACDGKLMAVVSVRTPSRDEQWRVLLQQGDTTLEPGRTALDENPHRTRYNGGLMFGQIRGYQYLHIFHFAPPESWSGAITIRYTDGFHPGAATANLAELAADELKHRR